MNKSELSKMLHEVTDAVNEWESSNLNKKKSERLVYWPIADEKIVASSEEYEKKRTYQISIFTSIPPDNSTVVKRLKEIFEKNDILSTIYYEFNEKDRIFHTYTSLEVIE